jgi:2-polyprenyl-6-methoxyphenol hydroxylase-like FAD-dependent oxidoreductase
MIVKGNRYWISSKVFEIVICGGGVSGLSLASVLARSDFFSKESILLIDPFLE